MVNAPTFLFYHRNWQLAASLLILLVSNLSLGRFMAEGRAISNQIETIHVHKGVEQEKKLMFRDQMIGSMPPRCENKCSNCGHCEAVQVPIIIHAHAHAQGNSHYFTTITYSRGDDISNYKPISWKCKCGNSILNP